MVLCQYSLECKEYHAFCEDFQGQMNCEIYRTYRAVDDILWPEERHAGLSGMVNEILENKKMGKDGRRR